MCLEEMHLGRVGLGVGGVWGVGGGQGLLVHLAAGRGGGGCRGRGREVGRQAQAGRIRGRSITSHLEMQRAVVARRRAECGIKHGLGRRGVRPRCAGAAWLGSELGSGLGLGLRLG